MKNFPRAAGVLFIVLLLSSFSYFCKADPMEAKSTEVLIKFRAGTSPERIEAIRNEIGLEKIKDIPKLGVTLFRIRSKLTPGQIVEKYKNHPHIEAIEPNYAYGLD